MNLKQLKQLIDDYELAHPARPLESVSVIEFEAWYSNSHRDLIVIDEVDELPELTPEMRERMRAMARRRARMAYPPSAYATRSGYAKEQETYVMPPAERTEFLSAVLDEGAKPKCAECGKPLPDDAIADGSPLCSPECVDDHYGPGSE